MKILLSGTNGYIGTRLLPLLLESNHFIYLLVRNPDRYHLPKTAIGKAKVIKGDFLDYASIKNLPTDIDAAYYLIHSMTGGDKNFDLEEKLAAENFVKAIEKTKCKQIIYLSGIVNDANLSKHLSSRLAVEEILNSGKVPLTTLKAAIIIGSGSSSFEIIRDLVEKSPFMLAPKWLNSLCQPISVVDVVDYLTKVLGKKECYHKSFDIGGPDKLTYKEMLLVYAEERKLHRSIFIVPISLPRLSSLWVFLATTTNYYLIRSLIFSLKNDVVCHENKIQEIIPKQCLTYRQSIQRAFQKIDDFAVLSSWRDAWSSSSLPPHYLDYIQVPTYGCLTSEHQSSFEKDPYKVFQSLIRVGDKNGYHLDWAWRIRGFIDRLFGGVGLRRGKTYREVPRVGDALDFWRVLVVDEERKRFLLYAEMKLPGEAWLESNIEKGKEKNILKIKATFRPHGLLGRLYWNFLSVFHFFIFKGLVKKIIRKAKDS